MPADNTMPEDLNFNFDSAEPVAAAEAAVIAPTSAGGAENTAANDSKAAAEDGTIVEGVEKTDKDSDSDAGGKDEKGDAGTGEEVKDISDALAKLNAEREEELRQIEERYAKKEFNLRCKSVSLGKRKGVAFDLVEKMRTTIRENTGHPYMSDEDADVLIKKAFDAGVSSLAS